MGMPRFILELQEECDKDAHLALTFVLFVQSYLICLLTQTVTLRGISISGESIKISNYADDTVIIPNGAENSIKEVTAVLKTFSSISGLNINFSKSHLFPLGPFHKNTPGYLSTFLFDTSDKPITYLGISFTNQPFFCS